MRTGRVVARVTDCMMAELGPREARLLHDRLLPEAQRRFPFCDLRLLRFEERCCWEVIAHGYIDAEPVLEKLPDDQGAIRTA